MVVEIIQNSDAEVGTTEMNFDTGFVGCDNGSKSV